MVNLWIYGIHHLIYGDYGDLSSNLGINYHKTIINHPQITVNIGGIIHSQIDGLFFFYAHQSSIVYALALRLVQIHDIIVELCILLTWTMSLTEESLEPVEVKDKVRTVTRKTKWSAFNFRSCPSCSYSPSQVPSQFRQGSRTISVTESGPLFRVYWYNIAHVDHVRPETTALSTSRDMW